MVFFTCGHCGDSIKKPAIEKHYRFRCHATPLLTCVDCLKDFKGQEYEAHTKCMTENERYSGKDYVEKPSAGKGEKKQKLLSNSIQELLEKNNLKHDEREIFQVISQYDNVPRKKAKFVNFLKNTCKAYANKVEVVERVWKKVEEIVGSLSVPQQEIVNGKEEKKDDKEMSGKKKSKERTEKIEEGTNGTEEPVKKSKRKLMNGEKTEEVKSKRQKSGENAGEEAEWVKKTGNQDWQATIVDILKKTGGRMAKSELQEQVFKHFVDFKALRKRFRSELKQLGNVTVEGGDVLFMADS